MKPANKVVKPTRADLLKAAEKTLPDILAPDLQLLFCGINPGLYSAFTGCHFARPGNRFWPTLFRAGFTKNLLAPSEQWKLLQYGYGITNIVARATATADELTSAELVAGASSLVQKVKRYAPKVLAVVGVSAYRIAFEEPDAQIGLQPRTIGTTAIWVLPNPSGLNAHYGPARLAAVFGELRASMG